MSITRESTRQTWTQIFYHSTATNSAARTGYLARPAFTETIRITSATKWTLLDRPSGQDPVKLLDKLPNAGN